MQYILSCAKTMSKKTSDMVANLITVPIFKAEANASALIIQGYSVEKLKEILKCSDDIARVNKRRYMEFFDEETKAPAIFSYTGVAYKALDVDGLSYKDLSYANDHLWICSFLYGLLRPLDGIHLYRLEGTAKIRDGKTMFDFWKGKLTDLLIDAVKADDGVLVHVATEEMTRLFDWRRVKREVNVVEPFFVVDDGKKEKIVSVYAKMCRGAMARFMIENRCTKVEQLMNFEYEGFRFVSESSESGRIVIKFVLG